MRDWKKATGLLSLLVWLLATGGIGFAVDVSLAAPHVDPPAPADAPALAEDAADQNASDGATARIVTLRAVEGDVTVRGAGGAAQTAEAGVQLAPGAQLDTGADGLAVLELEDGTVMVLSENASLTVTELDGTSDRPISRFLMRVGEVFAAREGTLADGAAFEIFTPHSVAAIRGSAMRITARPAVMRMACLEGHCYAGSLGEQVDVTGGQSVMVSERGGIVLGELTENDVAAWHAAVEAIRSAGLYAGAGRAPAWMTPVPVPPTMTPVPPTPVPPTPVPATVLPPTTVPAPADDTAGGEANTAAPGNSGNTPGGEHSSQAPGEWADTPAGGEPPPGQSNEPAAPPPVPDNAPGSSGETPANPPANPPNPPAAPPATGDEGPSDSPPDPPTTGDVAPPGGQQPPPAPNPPPTEPPPPPPPPNEPPPTEPPPPSGDGGGSGSTAPGNSGNTPGGEHSSQAPGQNKKP